VPTSDIEGCRTLRPVTLRTDVRSIIVDGEPLVSDASADAPAASTIMRASEWSRAEPPHGSARAAGRSRSDETALALSIICPYN
jgi:hypothetical protein